MGQYHKPVNVTKKEWLDPYAFGCGLKQWEQIANEPGGVCTALYMLLFTSNNRGGGDLDGEEYDPSTGEGVLGRWAGDDIRVIGDYNEKGDLPNNPREEYVDHYNWCDRPGENSSVEQQEGYVDISHLVIPILEKELGIKYNRTEYGWGSKVQDPNSNWSILPDTE